MPTGNPTHLFRLADREFKALTQGVPRHIQNLNAVAAHAGLSVTVSVEPYSNDPELRLWSKWSGSRAQLFTTGLLPPHEQRRLYGGERRPRKLTVPAGEYYRPLNCIATGQVTESGESIEWNIDCGSAQYAIHYKGEVEIVQYAKETLYHGSAGALIYAGIDRRRLPLGKRGSKSELGEWSCRRQPDGLLVYLEISAEVVQRQPGSGINGTHLHARPRGKMG